MPSHPSTLSHSTPPSAAPRARLWPRLSPRGWRWPLPALAAWAAGWAACLLAGAAGAGLGGALGAGALASACMAWFNAGRWRRSIAAAGFPLSALASGLGFGGAAAALPPWAWLLLLLPLLLAYPLRAWRDAPFFPTPADALTGLDAVIATPPQQVLDAGCGLGHGLAALHRLWPQARLHGVEWSAPLAWAAARRCRRFARVQRGDMWAASWAGNDVVYVFQRPESMARVMAKARSELAPGAWLVSLEFAVPDIAATAALHAPGAPTARAADVADNAPAPTRPLWLYRMPSPAISAGRGGSTASRPRR